MIARVGGHRKKHRTPLPQQVGGPIFILSSRGPQNPAPPLRPDFNINNYHQKRARKKKGEKKQKKKQEKPMI